MEKCGRCGGEGFQVWDEDGRQVQDVCYRCSGTGEIDEESAHDLRLEQVAYCLADQTVSAMRQARNEDPDGEGWAFCAAESMMSERDYTTAMMMDWAARHGEEISKMSRPMQDALILALLPKEEEAQPEPAAPPAPPTAPASDEIPF